MIAETLIALRDLVAIAAFVAMILVFAALGSSRAHATECVAKPNFDQGYWKYRLSRQGKCWHRAGAHSGKPTHEEHRAPPVSSPDHGPIDRREYDDDVPSPKVEARGESGTALVPKMAEVFPEHLEITTPTAPVAMLMTEAAAPMCQVVEPPPSSASADASRFDPYPLRAPDRNVLTHPVTVRAALLAALLSFASACALMTFVWYQMEKRRLSGWRTDKPIPKDKMPIQLTSVWDDEAFSWRKVGGPNPIVSFDGPRA